MAVDNAHLVAELEDEKNDAREGKSPNEVV